MKVITLEDGTRYVANLENDTKLYSAPVNPPNTGSRYTSGTDLFVHETKKHGFQFYLYHWSMWQGAEDSIEGITQSEAEDFLRKQVGDYWGYPDDADVKLAAEFGINLLEETA